MEKSFLSFGVSCLESVTGADAVVDALLRIVRKL